MENEGETSDERAKCSSRSKSATVGADVHGEDEAIMVSAEERATRWMTKITTIRDVRRCQVAGGGQR